MALHWSEFVQLENDSKMMFEKDLFDLSKLLGRPAPEFRGAQIDHHGVGRLSWLIESSVRRNIKSVSSRNIVFTIKDSTWVDGLCNATQRMLARLCNENKAELAETRFRFYGRRDSHGHPVPSLCHPEFQDHFMNMELILQMTQTDLLRTRIWSHLDRSSLTEGREREAQLQKGMATLQKKRITLSRTVAKLRRKVKEQDTMIATMERQANEMEEEGHDLRKENRAFLSDDDDYEEEMDCEEEDDDEEIVDEEKEEEELVDEDEDLTEAVLEEEEEEEDPEEPFYESDADVLELEVPPQ